MELGLASVTFRKLSAPEVAAAARHAGLSVVEWGGDVHCPPDDPQKLEAARGTGMKCASYGSYYRLGVSPEASFEPICRTAKALGASVVRIWAHKISPKLATPQDYTKLVFEAGRLSDTAEKYGLNICFEYHRDTLTETADAAKMLIEKIDRSNVMLYWQPNPDISCAENCAALKTVLPYTVNLHCFYWKNIGSTLEERNVRMPLREGAEDWKRYLDIASGGKIQNLYFEFVKGDRPECLADDAAALREILRKG